MTGAPALPAPTPSRLLSMDLLRWGLLASVLAFMPGGMLTLDEHLFPAELVLHVFAFAALALCLASPPARLWDAVDACLAAYAAAGVASALLAGNGWFAVRAVGLTLSGLAVFWVARRMAADGLGRELAGFAAAAAVVASATALLEAYGAIPSISAVNRAPGGTLGNRNAMAHLLVLGAPVLLALTMRARARWAVAAGMAGTAAIAAALVLSRSRAGWLGTLVVLATLGVAALVGRRALDRTRAVARGAGLALAVAVGVAGALLLPNTLNWTSDSPYAATLHGIMNFEYGSGRGRLIQYANTARMVEDNPLLGVGPGNWTIHYPRYATPDDPSYSPVALAPTNRLPQSDWVGLAAERGVPALLFLLAAGTLSARMVWRRLRTSARMGDADGVLLSGALLAMLAGLAVVGTTDPVLQTPTATFLVFTVLGALLPVRLRPAQAQAWTRPWLTLALPAAAVLAAAVPVGYAARQMLAGRLYAHGLDTAALERATRINPGDFRARMILGDALARARDCAALERHMAVAHRLFPTAPSVDALREQCRAHARAPRPSSTMPGGPPR